MCLLDTVDGALMMALYTSTAFAKDTIAILYYSIVLTVITVIVAVIIGTIQLLSLILNVAQPTGRFWAGVAVAGDHYDIIGKPPLFTTKSGVSPRRISALMACVSISGGAICTSFIVFGLLSVLLYKPWRRRIDRRRQVYQQPQRLQEDEDGEPVEPRGGATANAELDRETPAPGLDQDAMGSGGGGSFGSQEIPS